MWLGEHGPGRGNLGVTSPIPSSHRESPDNSLPLTWPLVPLSRKHRGGHDQMVTKVFSSDSLSGKGSRKERKRGRASTVLPVGQVLQNVSNLVLQVALGTAVLISQRKRLRLSVYQACCLGFTARTVQSLNLNIGLQLHGSWYSFHCTKVFFLTHFNVIFHLQKK